MKLLRYWLICLVLGVGSFSATTACANEKAAAAYAVSIGNKALTILSAPSADMQKQKQLEQMFTEIVDTDWIARFVLGPSWRKLSDAQKTDYLNTYRHFLVKHYTANFKEYSEGTTFKVTKSRPIGSNKQYLVSMAIVRTTSPQPINIDYRLQQQGESFRAIDIVVEGVSLLATQREEFSSVIQRDGLPHLLKLLKKKAA